jgi:hypothetical protein
VTSLLVAAALATAPAAGAEDCVAPPGKICSCQTAEEVLDPQAALMDGTMLRALMAVVSYREKKQRPPLRGSELAVENFHVAVSRKPSPRRANAYVVDFTAKSAPGEPEKLGSTHLGGSYTYFVDKKTLAVVSVERQE